MRINKPQFWQEKFSPYPVLLSPLTFLYFSVLKVKNFFTRQTKFKIPIICVGNIYVGGTGKTPLVLKIAQEINKKFKPVIIKKFYKNHLDEHELIRSKFKNLYLNSDRSKAITEAEKKKFKTVILDDGFQDYSIKKDLNILCFNTNQLIGNGWIFPSGPLREKFDNIKKANIIVINGDKNDQFEEKIFNISKNIKIFYSKYKPVNLNKFKNKKILAFAGIGNPDNFFNTLIENNLDVIKTLSYPDHYNFNESELQKIINMSKKEKLEIVTTEKDYYRIRKFKMKKIKFIKVKLEIFKNDDFIKQIKKKL